VPSLMHAAVSMWRVKSSRCRKAPWLMISPVPASSGQLPGTDIEWREGTSQLLRWLLAGRTWGPVFVTDRRAPTRATAANVVRLTGQARMSYRRAAEIFTTLTRRLDTDGRGWTLHQLSAAGRGRQVGRAPVRAT
jgi:hypothetical protein